jgi:translation initiation factor 1
MINKDKNSKVVYQTSNLADLRHLFSNDEEQNDVNSLPANEQNLGVRLEKKGRGGKTATLIKGYQGSNDELQALAKKLKQHCGVGGSAYNNEILIQGDQVQKVILFLQNEGYKVKKIGG